MKKIQISEYELKDFIAMMCGADDYVVGENGKSHDATINGKHIYLYEGEDGSEHAIMHVY